MIEEIEFSILTLHLYTFLFSVSYISLPSGWLQATKFFCLSVQMIILIYVPPKNPKNPKKKSIFRASDSVFRNSGTKQSSAFLKICKKNTSSRNQLLQHQRTMESHHLVIPSQLVPLQCQKGPSIKFLLMYTASQHHQKGPSSWYFLKLFFS